MTFRTTTLSAVLALVAGGVLAQEVQTITVPIGESAPAASTNGVIYSATPDTEGTPTVATPTGTDAAPADAGNIPAGLSAVTPESAAPEAADAAEATEAEAAPADDSSAAQPEPEAEAPAEGAADDSAAADDAVDVATPPEGDVAPAEDVEAGAVQGGPEVVDPADNAERADPSDGEAAPVAHETHSTDIDFPFEGLFGKYDQFQLQRGLQVYTEVCSSCHGMQYVAIRSLSDPNGPGLPEDQVRAYAAEFDIYDPEIDEDRPRLPTDHFPTVAGDGMGPDLSLLAKARAGFHGPYGTGLNQLFKGIGGTEYIYSILTGYTGETKEEAGSTFYENTAFAGGWIQMAQPIDDDYVTYEDGHPATLEDEAQDVAAFLMWAAEPKMMARKQTGLIAVIFLVLLSALLYLTNKRLWWPIKHGGTRR